LFVQTVCCFSGRESDYRRVLKEDGQEILMLAISSLEAAIGLLRNGAIEVQMLFLLKDHSERFVLLCKQIGKDENKSSSLSHLLHQRCTELIAFQKEQNNVSTFIRMCSCFETGSLILLGFKSSLTNRNLRVTLNRGTKIKYFVFFVFCFLFSKPS